MMSWLRIPGLRTEFPRQAAGEIGGALPLQQQQQQQQQGGGRAVQIRHGGCGGGGEVITPAPDWKALTAERDRQAMMHSDL